MRSIPDSLSDDSKLVLVHHLIREGLLKVVSVNRSEDIKSRLFDLALNQALALSTR